MTKRLEVWDIALAITGVRKWGTERFGRFARRRVLFAAMMFNALLTMVSSLI